MKKLRLLAVIAAVAAFGCGTASAQGKYGADSANCITYLSYYKEYFKQKNYDQALPNWRKAYKFCPPTANQTMLVDGTTLLRRVINQNLSNKQYRDALIDSLLTIHEQRAEYYPKYAVTSLNNKGTDISNFKKDDPKALYEGLNDVIVRLQSDVKASLLLFNLNAAIDLYQNGDLEAENVINTYQNNIALIESMNTEEADQEQNNKVKTDMESLFITSKVASCDNLIALFTPRYEADPENIDLVTNIVRMLSSTENCSDNDLYLNAATSLYKLNPTVQSAYFLYKLNSSRGNVDDAIKYMEEALSGEGIDEATAGSYNYELAAFCIKNGMNAKGFAAAEKVAALSPELAGKAYYLMGTVWGTTSCSGDEIARRAPYWVACDYMNKAKAADPALADDCNRLIAQYSVYFPQTAEAFMFDLSNGQSYTVSCGGMRAVTTVRTQK